MQRLIASTAKPNTLTDQIVSLGRAVMIALRVAKIALVVAIALFASLVTFGNLTDYNNNFFFVEHVLSMDTIYPFSTIKYRAITDSALHHAVYAVRFNRTKTFAILGLTLGFLLWQVGFMSIGGEWFGMWQSQQWNGVPSAFRFVMTISAVLILVAMRDHDAEPRSRP
jgi:predicted small integral membrane protein